VARRARGERTKPDRGGRSGGLEEARQEHEAARQVGGAEGGVGVPLEFPAPVWRHALFLPFAGQLVPCSRPTPRRCRLFSRQREAL
jgi:hypothetical protein